MKLNALSNYDGDKETRFGDCILVFSNKELLVYDCGHERHAEEVMSFLKKHSKITDIVIVNSHNDSDHVDGVIPLLEFLDNKDYSVTVYTSLYLKNIDEIHEKLDDGRRKKNKTCEHILELFNNIADIVNKAQELGFEVKNAIKNTDIALGTIVGPSKEDFIKVVTKAIEDNGEGKINGETVMNAASIQVKCVLDDKKVLLLCGDASPEYISNIESYDIIQLPHHGQLKDAETIFDMLEDAYSKEFLISDNTGLAHNSGGSHKLVKKMKKEKYTPAYNTQNGVIELPKSDRKIHRESQGVSLGDLDC